MFVLLMSVPIAGFALIVFKGSWSPWLAVLLPAISVSFLLFSIGDIVIFMRMKPSSIYYDGHFHIAGTPISSGDIIGIEEVFLNPGFKAPKYSFLRFIYQTHEGTAQALCISRDGWFIKDWLTDRTKSTRLLLRESPEMESVILPMRLVKHTSEILTSIHG